MDHIARPDGQLEKVHTAADNAPVSALQLTDYSDMPGYAIRLPDRTPDPDSMRNPYRGA